MSSLYCPAEEWVKMISNMQSNVYVFLSFSRLLFLQISSYSLQNFIAVLYLNVSNTATRTFFCNVLISFCHYFETKTQWTEYSVHILYILYIVYFLCLMRLLVWRGRKCLGENRIKPDGQIFHTFPQNNLNDISLHAERVSIIVL